MRRKVSKIKVFLLWWALLSALLFLAYLSLPWIIPRLGSFAFSRGGIRVVECPMTYSGPWKFVSELCTLSPIGGREEARLIVSKLDVSLEAGFREPIIRAQSLKLISTDFEVSAGGLDLKPASQLSRGANRFGAELRQVLIRYRALSTHLGDVRADIDVNDSEGKLQISNQLFRQSKAVAESGVAAMPLDATVVFRQQEGLGRAEIEVGPLEVNEGRPISTYIHGLSLPFELQNGALRLSAKLPFGLSGLKTESQATLSLRNISVNAESVQLIDAEAILQFQGFPHWRTEKNTFVKIPTLDIGFPVTNIQFVPNIEGKLANVTLAELTQLQAEIFGGRFAAASIQRKGGQIEPFRVSVDSVDVERLLAQMGEAVQGDGKLSGVLPFEVEEGAPVVRSGKLRSLEPGGNLRYVRNDPGGKADGADPNLKFAMKALEQFAYESMDVLLNYDKQGNLSASVAMLGRNPSISAARQIQFSVNIEQNIPSLLRSLRVATKGASEIWKPNQ